MCAEDIKHINNIHLIDQRVQFLNFRKPLHQQQTMIVKVAGKPSLNYLNKQQ